MAEGYQVITDALVGHTVSLGRVHDQLAVALDAAQQVSLPTDAYGVICQFFPPMVDPIERSGVAALSAAVLSVDDTVTAVRNTARDYDAVDATNSSSFGGGSQ